MSLTEKPSEAILPVSEPEPTALGPQKRGILLRLASLRLTLVCIVMLLVAVVYIYDSGGEANATVPLVAPLTLLAINLMAALLTNKTFRRQLPLQIFHLCLVAVVVFAALGRLTYLRATTEVVVGGEYRSLDRIDAGPWHWGAKDKIQFENLGFTIAYKPGLRRDATVNQVRVRDGLGLSQIMEIGDQVPLVLHGYRFYTSSNKGFAAIFRWEPVAGQPETGSVIFPGYPSNAGAQSARWQLGIDSVKVNLNLPAPLIDAEQQSQFRMPEQHDVTLDFPLRVATLKPGESVMVPSGRVVYLGLTSWMGYNVFYDWTMSWMLMACALAVMALGWHFWEKFAQRPWRPELP